MLIVVIGYAPSVFAAESILGPLDIPLATYGYVALMGTWGSVASLLQKFAKGLPQGRWHLTALSDIINANLAAILIFLVCEHYKVPKALEAIAFTLAGYGGARSMEWLYNRSMGTGEAVVGKALGIPLPPSPTEQADITTQP